MKDVMHDHYPWPVTVSIGIIAGLVGVFSPLTFVAIPPLVLSIGQTVLLSLLGGSITFWVQRWWRKRFPENDVKQLDTETK